VRITENVKRSGENSGMVGGVKRGWGRWRQLKNGGGRGVNLEAAAATEGQETNGGYRKMKNISSDERRKYLKENEENVAIARRRK